MPKDLPTFRSPGRVVVADTCEPLKAAERRGDVAVRAFSRGLYPGRRLPPSDLREVRTVGTWDAPAPQRWGLDWHCNEGIEFTLLEGGRTAFSVDGRNAVLHPGDLTITRPWQRHRVGNPCVGASRLHWLILDVGVRRPNQPWRWPRWLLADEAALRRLAQILRHNERPVWRSTPDVRRCFARLSETCAGRGGPDLTRLKIYINELLVAVGEMLERKRVPLDADLSSTRRTVELFLQDLARRVGEDWTLERMAAQCGLGATRFAWYCKQITNRTPVQHLARCRVDAAERMLRERPEANITEVAFTCGFQSSQYFATVFRGLTGRSPREARGGK